jgi:hypothetical protein
MIEGELPSLDCVTLQSWGIAVSSIGWQVMEHSRRSE